MLILFFIGTFSFHKRRPTSFKIYNYVSLSTDNICPFINYSASNQIWWTYNVMVEMFTLSGSCPMVAYYQFVSSRPCLLMLALGGQRLINKTMEVIMVKLATGWDWPGTEQPNPLCGESHLNWMCVFIVNKCAPLKLEVCYSRIGQRGGMSECVNASFLCYILYGNAQCSVIDDVLSLSAPGLESAYTLILMRFDPLTTHEPPRCHS